MKEVNISEIIIILIGIFLFLDDIFVHALSYNYSKVGLGFLNPVIDHWWIGLILIGIGVIEKW